MSSFRTKIVQSPRNSATSRTLSGKRSGHVHLQLDGEALGEPVQRARDGPRDARAHEHVVHVREDRAEQGGQRGDLHLLEQVHPDEAVVAFLGEEDPHEGPEHEQVHQRGRGIDAR